MSHIASNATRLIFGIIVVTSLFFISNPAHAETDTTSQDSLIANLQERNFLRF